MGPMAKAGGAPPAIRLLSIPKEGERVLAPTRRPDGILRKPIRIRAGYVPQDEVAIYQSKGALLSKSSEATVPPGYDPDLAEKTKTKSARRNERKKEKRHQAALEKEKNMVSEGAEVQYQRCQTLLQNQWKSQKPSLLARILIRKFQHLKKRIDVHVAIHSETSAS
ncbi:partner of Y14 and mago-like isoform X6 [Zingiber officinale]|uniref:partner of Y14 and mago-like isoform X6 n=1 Tax=Zingiber officinale TaxID=94328 RepID=UPI001C4C0E5D|nr:partner of Y14 and mago-like isoform X6 [Zingiber officinale]